MESNFYKILDEAVEMGASDIHLTNNLSPTLRIDGVLTKLKEFDVNNEDILRGFVKEILGSDELEQYEEDMDIDASMSYGEVRFRIHIFRQNNTDAIALRSIPRVIPTFEEINLPEAIGRFTDISNGLVLVTGMTGSGKSTTLASIIDMINSTDSKHIVTVEDPVEYIHEHKKSIVNQREVGTDVKSYSRAVRAAMREDPDILLVGELRDLETIQNAITMAETGHLVFGTLHTRSVSETVGRLIDVFPANQQEQIRIQLANSISGIIAQELLPKVGGGRVPCCEIMFANDAIRSIIRENQNTSSIVDQMETTTLDMGSQSRLIALSKLLADNKITDKEAKKGLSKEQITLLSRMLTRYGRRGSN